MRHGCSLLLCLMLLLSPARSPGQESPAIPPDLQEPYEAYATAMVEGDAERAIEFYAENAVVLVDHEHVYRGRQAIREGFLANYLEVANRADEDGPGTEIGVDRVLADEGVVTLAGRYANPSGAAGVYSNTWKRQDDGSWKLAASVLTFERSDRTPAKSSGGFACTHVLGFSQSMEWYAGLSVVDHRDEGTRPDLSALEPGAFLPAWQGRFFMGAAVEAWRDPDYRGWSGAHRRAHETPAHCARDEVDRVVFNVSGAARPADAWAAAVDSVTDVIRSKFPAVRRVVMQPVVGAPEGTCEDVRAARNHSVIVDGIRRAADRSGITAGPSPKVAGCDQFSDALGHLTVEGAEHVRRILREHYRPSTTGPGRDRRAAGCTEAPVDRDSGFAIENVNVVNVRAGEVREGQTVVVQGSRIAEVAPASAVRPGDGVTRVDGTGRYLIPGLWDMHVHFGMPFARDPGRELTMSLAHGVTGVRDLGATPEVFRTLKAWRRDVRAGEVPGPRLHMAGLIVDGEPPARPHYLTATDAGEGRAAVERLQEMGADFVKVYDGVPPEAFHAIVEEAEGRGLAVAGHVPDVVGPVAASGAGVTTLEHADELGFHITDAKPPSGSEVDSGAHPLARMRAFERYDEQKAGAVIEAFAENETAVVPTLHTVHVLARYGPEDFEEGPLARLVSERQKRERLDDLPHDVTGRERAGFERAYRNLRTMLARMHAEGVTLLAGSHAPIPLIPYGYGLHQEMTRLSEAGLGPAGALRTATLHAARVMGRLDELGTVEAGKLADLVLLDVNPLDDIRNTRRVRAVVIDGQLLDRDRLDAMLERAGEDWGD